ncbi:unnamed protein product [Xylocopa violacea]|uniref:Uncharacterized protein n=1 Tax=Xylocopa violacea TaxID=135666 RepID=A0ABP1NR21_XYLVO
MPALTAHVLTSRSPSRWSRVFEYTLEGISLLKPRCKGQRISGKEVAGSLGGLRVHKGPFFTVVDVQRSESDPTFVNSSISDAKLCDSQTATTGFSWHETAAGTVHLFNVSVFGHSHGMINDASSYASSNTVCELNEQFIWRTKRVRFLAAKKKKQRCTTVRLLLHLRRLRVKYREDQEEEEPWADTIHHPAYHKISAALLNHRCEDVHKSWNR